MNKILVIGAHYDDCELGAGGAMAKWVRDGASVYKMTLTDNVTNFAYNDAHINQDQSIRESAQACAVLGVTEVLTISTAVCTELSYNKKQMQEIEAFILDNEIDTVVTHYLHDVQQDHVHASIISYVAGRYCDNILMYQSNRYVLPENYYPRVFVDITETIEQKRRALQCYTGGHDRHGNLFEITINLNRMYGYSAKKTRGESYAEAFHVHKMVI